MHPIPVTHLQQEIPSISNKRSSNESEDLTNIGIHHNMASSHHCLSLIEQQLTDATDEQKGFLLFLGACFILMMIFISFSTEKYFLPLMSAMTSFLISFIVFYLLHGTDACNEISANASVYDATFLNTTWPGYQSKLVIFVMDNLKIPSNQFGVDTLRDICSGTRSATTTVGCVIADRYVEAYTHHYELKQNTEAQNSFRAAFAVGGYDLRTLYFVFAMFLTLIIASAPSVRAFVSKKTVAVQGAILEPVITE